MTLTVVERHTTYFTPAPRSGRPIVAGVLHDTETLGVPAPHAGGSWHYLVGRDGRVYRDVPEAHCAWSVAAADRRRPTWLVPSPLRLSDVNWCTLGVELVSHQAYRDAGEPYTAAQYQALRAIVADVHARHGPLPWIGHGDLQRDRDDPVAFDWERAGFGPWQPDGRRWLGTSQPPGPSGDTAAEGHERGDRTASAISQEDQAILDLVRGLGADAGSIAGWINQIGALEEQLAELSRRLLAAERRVDTVTLTYDDGSTLQFRAN